MHELIVDSFAGGGGASTGIEMALGRSPDYAINHDREALALHAANHPDTIHLSENIYKVDPMDVVGRRPVGLLWASPDCKHFSKAKGGAPVKRNIRDLAWTVVLWAERVSPRVIILENVEEFQGWGPLVENAKGELVPCKDRRGQTFKDWVKALKKLGYVVEWKELRACDFGAPTTRKRLFVIARRVGKPIEWPAPTHAAPGKDDRLLPYRTAAHDVIDWSIPCPSIFDSSEEIMQRYGVRAVRPLAEATLARIAKGVKRYVIDAAKPFLIRVDQTSGDAARKGVWPATDPVTTLHTAQSHAVVVPHIVDVAHGEVSPSGVKRWGSGVKPADAPMGNVTAGGIQQGVVAAHLMTMRNAGKPFNEADKPTHTVTAGGADLSLVATSLVQTGYGERDGQEPRALDPGAPLGTVVASGVKHAAVSAFLKRLPEAALGDHFARAEAPNERDELPDRREADQDVDDPGCHVALAAEYLGNEVDLEETNQAPVDPSHDDEQEGENVEGAHDNLRFDDVESPTCLSTLRSAFLAQHNNDRGVVPNGGRDAREPLSALTTTPQQAVVSAGLINLKGSDRRMSDVEEPSPAVTSQGNHLGEARAFLMKYYGVDQDPRIEEPLSTVTTRDRFGIVTVEGEEYVITDIGMRMLTPRELFKAQGFPPDYEIETGLFEDGTRKPLTKTAQVRMCGNSVCPPIAAALVSANCNDLAVASREAAE